MVHSYQNTKLVKRLVCYLTQFARHFDESSALYTRGSHTRRPLVSLTCHSVTVYLGLGDVAKARASSHANSHKALPHMDKVQKFSDKAVATRDWYQDAIESLAKGTYSDPFGILGPHWTERN